MPEAFPKSVRRMWVHLTIVWAVAWLLGLLVFVIVTGLLVERYYNEQIESRLRIQAIAVYGLAFFNDTGEFESGLLDYEDELFEPSAGIWFVEPGEPAKIHLSDDARFSSDKLLTIAQRVVQSGTEFQEAGTDQFGRPFRLLAIPTYDVEGVEPKAAIVVANNPSRMDQAKRRFLNWIVCCWFLLGLVGIAIGSWIANWSLKPLARFISQREQFLSAAAHELRTPLASISAVVDSGNAGNESAMVAINRLTPLVSRATECTEDLLLYARLDAGAELIQKEPIRLDLLIEAEAPEDSKIQLRLQETIINGDAKLLRALVRNLLSNAVRHANNPGQVLVTLQDRTLRFENDGDLFSEDIISRQSTDFRLSPSSTGSGFGLAIAQMIAKLHHGELQVENSVENKARVTLNFLEL